MRKKEIVGKTFPLKGLFYLHSLKPIYLISNLADIKDKFKKNKYKLIDYGIILKEDSSGYRFLLAKMDSRRGKNSTFIYEMFLGKRSNIEKQIEFFKRTIFNGGIIKNGKIISGSDINKSESTIIRFGYCENEDVESFEKEKNKREIIILPIGEGKRTFRTYRGYIFKGLEEDKSIIGYKIQRNPSRTGMHECIYLLLVRYKNIPCSFKIEEISVSGRGNRSETIIDCSNILKKRNNNEF